MNANDGYNGRCPTPQDSRQSLGGRMYTLIYRPWRALILATLVMVLIITGSAVTRAASAAAATGGTGGTDDVTAVIMQRFRMQDTALMPNGNAASMASVYA